MLTCSAFSLVLAAGLVAAPPQVQVQTFSGQAVSGALVEVTADKVVVEGAAGPTTVNVQDLLNLTIPASPVVPASGAYEVVLVDGSILPVKDFKVAKGTAKVTLISGGELELPNRDIARVRVQSLNDGLAGQFDKILEREIGTDVLVIRKDDSLDFLEGVMGDVNDRYEFDPGTGVVRVKPEKVFAIRYFHKAGREFKPAVCMVTDTSGAQFSVAKFTLAGNEFKLTTTAGLEIARPVDKLSRFDFSQGKIQYLSDMKPLVMEHTPWFGGERAVDTLPKPDRSLDGGPLSIEGRAFNKGVAVRSRTQLVYRLGREYRRFQTVVGIDDSIGARGNAKVIIRGDDRVLFTGDLSGNDKPRGKALDLDVSGVNRLELFIDYGKNRDEGDHVDFCEARIIK